MTGLFFLKGATKLNLNQYEIPKEIKTKPKLLGLDIKEMAFVIILIILIMTFFKDMVHGWFVIPYFIVSIGFLFYMIAPSSNNPQKKNYHSVLLFFKRDKKTYHTLDVHQSDNDEIKHLVESENVKRGIEKPRINIKTITNENEVYDNKEEINQVKIIAEKHKEPVEQVVVQTSFSEDKKSTVKESSFPDEINLASYEKDVEEPKKEMQDRLDTHLNSREERQKISNTLRVINVLKENSRATDKPIKKDIEGKLSGLAQAIPSAEEQVSIYHNKKSSWEKLKMTLNHRLFNKNLVQALRHFSAGNYELSKTHFIKLDYSKLSEGDKRLFLLALIYTGEGDEAILLNPQVAKEVLDYHKSRDEFDRIRMISTKVKSVEITFEVAIDDDDYWKIIELKDFVELNEERHKKVIDAYIQLNHEQRARHHANELGDEKILEYVKDQIKNGAYGGGYIEKHI